MKKDGRFWILIGALAIVGGLFLAFLWSVMRAPGQPAMVQPTANVTETTNGAADATPTGDKPADPFAQQSDIDAAYSPPPPPDTARIIREAQEASERAQRQAAEAQARVRAEANRALERARQQTERARQRAQAQSSGGKPEDDGKPPADW